MEQVWNPCVLICRELWIGRNHNSKCNHCRHYHKHSHCGVVVFHRRCSSSPSSRSRIGSLLISRLISVSSRRSFCMAPSALFMAIFDLSNYRTISSKSGQNFLDFDCGDSDGFVEYCSQLFIYPHLRVGLLRKSISNVSFSKKHFLWQAENLVANCSLCGNLLERFASSDMERMDPRSLFPSQIEVISSFGNSQQFVVSHRGRVVGMRMKMTIRCLAMKCWQS